MVYFLAALKGNDTIIKKLFRLPAIKRFEEDEDLLEDLVIENNQAIETTELYTGILESITTSYSSLLFNEMNNIMKTLTLFTVLLTLPTLVFSFFGMNVRFHSMKKLFIVALYRRYLTCTRYNSKYLLMAKTKIITANYTKSRHSA